MAPRAAAVAAASALALSAASAAAAPGAGTIDDPIVVDILPYALASTTLGAASDGIDGYDCSPADESGPEVVFAFTLDMQARMSAWVEGDDGTVDVDVHLLTALAVDGGVASGCAARGNAVAEAELDPGTHYVVVDSFGGESQSGPFVLRLDAIGDAWSEREVAAGVTWRARRFESLAGGGQVVHELLVDTKHPDVRIEALPAAGCQTVGAVGSAAGAVAGVNGGYFDVASCAPVSLLVHGGATIATNAKARGAFGLAADGTPAVAVVPAGEPWAGVAEAHGGGPVLVVGGAAEQGDQAWADQGFTSSGFVGKNPRTYAGFDAGGQVHLGTIDGRRSNALGMSLDELASFVASAEIGAGEVVNLDGGGSSTLWIAGATPNGVVNYPSDEPAQELATHPGSRAVSGGFFVFAPPLNHAPRFTTKPVSPAEAGAPWAYDADALDLDVFDVVTFGLGAGPSDMTVDPVTGEVSWAPTVEAPPDVDVVIVASDDHGAATEQSFTLHVTGAVGPGAGGAGGGSAGGPPGAVPDADGGSAADDSGCGCRAGTAASSPAAGLAVWAALATAARLRRRRADSAQRRPRS